MVGLELTLNGEENRFSASNLEHIMEDQLKEMLLRVKHEIERCLFYQSCSDNLR